MSRVCGLSYFGRVLALPSRFASFHSFTATASSFTASVHQPQARHCTRDGKRAALVSISSPAALTHAGQGFRPSFFMLRPV
jgi:hypothetical protein